MSKICSIPSCGKGGKIRRGWCEAHYKKWSKYGDPLAGGTWYSTPEECFLMRTHPEPNTGCLLWSGCVNDQGYGYLRENGTTVSVHRFAWKEAYGYYPDKGIELDHTCHVRNCAEVSHLRLVSHSQNGSSLSGARVTSGTGVRGVFRTEGGKFKARVTKDYVSFHIGTFETISDAEEAVARARKELYGEYAGKN